MKLENKLWDSERYVKSFSSYHPEINPEEKE